MPVLPPADRRLRWFAERGRLAAQALVLALVVSATGAFALLYKTVTLDVDGSTSTFSGFGRTVEDVLAATDVAVADGDLVVPALGEVIADQGEIVVRHGREVVVEIDGRERTVWTTGLTVADVLAELDLREGYRASSSRSAEIGRDVLRLSTPKTVTLVADGTTAPITTTGVTVREVMQEAGVVLGERDRVSVALDAPVVDGLVIMVTRVQAVTRSETSTQPFETVREEDAGVELGTEEVAVEGREGSRAVTFVAYEVDGVEIGRTVLAESVLRAPVNQVIKVGTYVAPVQPEAPDKASGPALANVPPVEPGTSRAIGLQAVLDRGWDEAQFACLDALWTKESGWRVNAYNASSGAFGIPQSLPGNKMATAGADWQTNPATQIEWGLGYIAGRYGTPCGAWAQSQARNWY